MTSKHFVTLTIGALAIMATPAFAAPNLLVNGDFETPTAPGSPGYANYAAGDSSITGWTITSGDVDVVSALFSPTNPASVGQWLDLVGFNPGMIAQTFATTAGKTYNLSFLYGSNSSVGSSRSASVSVGNLATTISSSAGLNFTGYSNVFKATGSSTTISFGDIGGTANGGIALDSIFISGVPETSTWVMMIGGMGLVGGAMRRRRALSLRTA